VYEGEVFQSNVYIVSQLEDKFNVPVKNLFISSAFERAIHDLSEFYYQDLCDGSFSIDIMTSDYKNPFNIVEWILTSNISQGTNLSIDMDTIPVIWMTDEIFNSIYSYVNSFVYESYIQIIK
jgi:hypothetical protein